MSRTSWCRREFRAINEGITGTFARSLKISRLCAKNALAQGTQNILASAACAAASMNIGTQTNPEATGFLRLSSLLAMKGEWGTAL